MSDDYEQDDLLAVYSAVVDYHNNLVHMRFTVARLYLIGVKSTLDSC